MADAGRMNRPDTNIPRVGILTGISYMPPGTKYPDMHEIKISGVWENEGTGHFYMAYKSALPSFCAAGLVRHDGVDSAGKPKLTLVVANQRIMIRIREDGKQKPVDVFCYDLNGQPVQLAAQPVPPPPPGAAAPAPAAAAGAPPLPPAGAAPGAASGGAPALPPSGGQGAPAAGQAPQQPAPGTPPQQQKRGISKTQYMEMWAGISEAYVIAQRISLRSFLDGVGMTLDEFRGLELEQRLAIFAVTSPRGDTVMIRSEKLGIVGYRGMVADVDKLNPNGGEEDQPWRLIKAALTGLHPSEIKHIAEPAPPIGKASGKKEPPPADEGSESADDDDGLPF